MLASVTLLPVFGVPDRSGMRLRAKVEGVGFGK